jgi:hypothetical protein
LFDSYRCDSFEKAEIEVKVEKRLSKITMKDVQDFGGGEDGGKFQMIISKNRVDHIKSG